MAVCIGVAGQPTFATLVRACVVTRAPLVSSLRPHLGLCARRACAGVCPAGAPAGPVQHQGGAGGAFLQVSRQYRQYSGGQHCGGQGRQRATADGWSGHCSEQRPAGQGIMPLRLELLMWRALHGLLLYCPPVLPAGTRCRRSTTRCGAAWPACGRRSSPWWRRRGRSSRWVGLGWLAGWPGGNYRAGSSSW